MRSAAASKAQTLSARWWESRSQQLLTAAFVAAGVTLAMSKSRSTPSTAQRHDPHAELHAPPPGDPHARATARIAAAVGADPSDAEADTVFDNRRIAGGKIGDLLPAGRRAKAREEAEKAAGAEVGELTAAAVNAKAPPAVPRSALDKGPGPAQARAAADEEAPVKKRG